MELFRSKGAYISENAATVIAILGGKRMLTAYERVYWFDLPDPSAASSFTVSTIERSWISVCETRYPGTVFLRDDGALFFDDDSPSPWFISIEK
jgi:hypothetical protein